MQHLPVLFRDSLLATVLFNGLSPPELLVLVWFAGQGHPLGISKLSCLRFPWNWVGEMTG